jgi:hypothetical protein
MLGVGMTAPKRFARVLVHSHFLVWFSFLGRSFFSMLSFCIANLFS